MSKHPTHWNIDLFDTRGNYVGCPDAWWDDVGMAWEIDSFDFHFWRKEYERTTERNTRYAKAGVTVVHTLPSRLLSDPSAVLQDLEAAYRTAASRPRPPVHLASNP
jgi:hypothetical protein